MTKLITTIKEDKVAADQIPESARGSLTGNLEALSVNTVLDDSPDTSPREVSMGMFLQNILNDAVADHSKGSELRYLVTSDAAGLAKFSVATLFEKYLSVAYPDSAHKLSANLRLQIKLAFLTAMVNAIAMVRTIVLDSTDAKKAFERLRALFDEGNMLLQDLQDKAEAVGAVGPAEPKKDGNKSI